MILCVSESLWIRTSSAINPQSRSDRVRGKWLLDSVVPSCTWFCVFYNFAKALWVSRVPGFVLLCSILESNLVALEMFFAPLVPRKIQVSLGSTCGAIVGVDVSAPYREWRTGSLFEVQDFRLGGLFMESYLVRVWGWEKMLGQEARWYRM